jgi:hypothetical protein
MRVSVEKEMKVICDEIRNDEGYYYGWQSNIAMAFKDEYSRKIGRVSQEHWDQIHDIANQAAKNFLDILIMEREK